MCSIITVRFEPGQLRQFFPEVRDPSGCDASGVNLRTHGYLKKETAPVVFLNAQKELVVDYKCYSLCPSWVKEWPAPFETYNARLSRPKKTKDARTGLWKNQLNAQGKIIDEYIFSVPAFRDAFNKGQTCLVPVSGIVESCYFGTSAGHVVRFCVNSSPVVFLLGLWNDWVNPHTNEVIPTFTLLTDSPDAVLFSHGHDRGVLAAKESAWLPWLSETNMSGSERLQFARASRTQPDWRAETERKLKTGWARKAPTPDEIKRTEVWHASG